MVRSIRLRKPKSNVRTDRVAIGFVVHWTLEVEFRFLNSGLLTAAAAKVVPCSPLPSASASR